LKSGFGAFDIPTGSEDVRLLWKTGSRRRKAEGYVEGREMVNSFMLLAFEANGVIALRMMKLMRGGKRARREAELMVSEKIHAAIEATASLMAGASGDEIVHRYRRHIAANAKRLGGLNSGRSRKRALRRTRSRWKWPTTFS
jgi:hypothetical protein